MFQEYLLCWENIHSYSQGRRFWNGYKTIGGARAALPLYPARVLTHRTQHNVVIKLQCSAEMVLATAN